MNLSACLVLLSSIFHLTSASRPWMGTLIHNQQDPATTTTTTDTAIAPPPTATYLYINTTTPQTLCNISETGARRRSRHPHRRDAHRPKSGPSSPPPPPPPPAAAAPQNKDGGEFDGDEHEVVESRSGSNTSPLADCAALAATYASHDGYWDVTASGPGRSGWQYFARGSCSFGLSPEFSAGGRSGALWLVRLPVYLFCIYLLPVFVGTLCGHTCARDADEGHMGGR